MKWLTEDMQCADITFKKDAAGPPDGMCVNSTGVGASAFAFASSGSGSSNQGNSSKNGNESTCKSGASKTTVGMLSAVGLFAAGLALF